MTRSIIHETNDGGRIGQRPLLAACSTLVVGLLLTLAAAEISRTRMVRERELTFDHDAEVVKQTLTASINDLSTKFQSALSFIGSTHPLPPTVYVDYFERELVYRAGIDPGILFMEEVPRNGFAALEAREQRLGHEGFEVKSLGLFDPDGPALVVTRAGEAQDAKPFPFIGYDISFGKSLLLPEELPEVGYVLRVGSVASILARAVNAEVDDLDDVEKIPEVTPFFVGQALDGDGNSIGLALQFLDADRVSERLVLPENLNVRLFVEGIDKPIVEAPLRPSAEPSSAELAERLTIVTASQSWLMEVWADPEFGEQAGLLDQRGVWLNGLAISATLALMAAASAYHRRRLAGASFELQHARTLATTDHLTGLLNRQGLIDAARALPADKNATLYFIDLDGFKTVNDDRGHEAGDAVLAGVANVLRTTFRHDDLVSRLGGDEFVVFTTGDRPEINVHLIAERVVRRIDRIDPEVSCSLGIAHRPPNDGADVKDLLRLADKAMYRAKRDGGDRFAIA